MKRFWEFVDLNAITVKGQTVNNIGLHYVRRRSKINEKRTVAITAIYAQTFNRRI